MPQVCRVLEEIHQSVGRDGHFDTRYIRDFATIKGRICYKLINAEQNAAWLREIPHRLYQDLAIIYYILVERNNMGGACIMVRNDVMERWGVDESALYELARKNTPVLLKAKIAPMADVLKGFMDVKDFKDESSLYVATNEHRANGAIVMLYDEVLEHCSYPQNPVKRNVKYWKWYVKSIGTVYLRKKFYQIVCTAMMQRRAVSR